MVRTAIVLALLAACGSVKRGDGDSDGGPGDGDGGSQPDANPITELSVELEVGTGGGSVSSGDGSIDCGSTCDATLDTGTEVTLTATADAGSAFVAWRGASARDCRRATECTITLTGGPQAVGALFAEKGTAGWALQIGSSVGDSISHVIIDKNGDLFISASFGGGFEFAGQTYENLGSSDIFLAKLTPGGEVLWAKAFGSDTSDGVAHIAADPVSGDLVIGGYYQAPIDFGGSEVLEIADGEDLFVVRLAADTGELVWQKPIQVSDNDGPGFGGLAVDAEGDVIVTGHFNTSINLGAATLTTVSGLQEMYLAKLHGEDGTVDWQRKMAGDASYAIAYQMVVDGNGAPIIAGQFGDVVDFDGVAGTDMTALGVTDGFVAKFSPANGSLVWQRQVGGTGGSDEARGIALGPNNSVVVGMYYNVVESEQVLFLGNPLTGSGTGVDIVVGRISSNGNFVWGKRFGGAGSESLFRLATFQDGRVAATGYFAQNFSMDSQTLTFEGATSDSFFAVLAAANGNASYATRVGSLVGDLGIFTAGFDDQLYGAGNFQEAGSFLGKTLNSVGSSDGYLFVAPLP